MSIIEFPSYEEALQSCGEGYDSDDIATVVARKTARSVPLIHKTVTNSDPHAVSALSVLLAQQLKKTGDRTVNVLDIGGACGYSFFVCRSILRDVDMHWCVVETDSMVDKARHYIRGKNISFFASIEEALEHLGGCDLVHMSGVLQFVRSPEHTLDRAVAIGAPIMLLGRIPLFKGRRTFGVQTSRLASNGPGPMPAGLEDREIRYPITYINYDEIMNRVNPFYDSISTLDAPSGNSNLEKEHVPGVSIILHRKASA